MPAAFTTPGAPLGRAARGLSARLPDFPWDSLTPYGDRARSHPGGIVDLSVGTPVDPVPAVVQEALRAGSNAPGYPAAYGTGELRAAAADWLRRRLGVTGADPAAVIPTIGSKELVAWLPTMLGIGPGERVAFPELAYPTYAVGALLAGAEPVAYADPRELDPAGLRLVWINSPANPTGAVLSAEDLAAIVGWARAHDVVVASDECYTELGWEAVPVSVLHPDVCGTGHDGLLAVHSLSKRSNLAGYRAGFVAGDPAVVRELLGVRKHSGMLPPSPVQAAATAALADDAHVTEVRARYASRRERLRSALAGAGFRIDRSEGGLYLWATRGESCWTTVSALADLGILVAPGDFYGEGGREHVRVALTATDERIAAAADRLRPR